MFLKLRLINVLKIVVLLNKSRDVFDFDSPSERVTGMGVYKNTKNFN